MSLELLLICIFFLLLSSAFFSASETAMMAINRYRLKHDAKTNNTAKLVFALLLRSDLLLSVVLICNNFVNIAAASIATIIGLRLYGDFGAFIATVVLTFLVLLFSEITPKIIASEKSETIAYIAARPLNLLIKGLYPIVWLANAMASVLLKIMGIKKSLQSDLLTIDELRTVVTESGNVIPTRHKSMLTSILDLEHISVDDIMITKADVEGIDLDHDDETILANIRSSKHTLLPIYRGDIDEIYGIIHLRDLSRSLTEHKFTKALLLSLADKPYFVPEGTALHTQLFNFQRNKQRFGVVVDEYGAILGIVTLADILEEIVGEFTTDLHSNPKIIPQSDNSFLVDGSTNIRSFNQIMHWDLPTDTAKTISGAIIAHLEMIPTPRTCILLNGHPVEIILVQDNTVKSCKIGPKIIDDSAN